MEFMVPDSVIEEWLKEDVGYYDLTTKALRIGSRKAQAEVILREKAFLCGIHEATKVYMMAGADEVELVEEERWDEGVVLRARGFAADLHKAWRVAQNVIAVASGVATYTRRMVEEAKKHNPNVKVIVVRKAPPGRWLYYRGALCGGASLHRTSLSDTVVLFKNHVNFLGFEEALKRLKESDLVWDKKVVIEVESLEEALKAVDYGFEMIQVDHKSPKELREIYEKVKEKNPKVKVLAAGGIKLENVKDYAFVDAILTSAPYWAKPIDVTTKIVPL